MSTGARHGRWLEKLQGQAMIGVFDSGIGGLTVVRCIMDQLPDEAIVYLGDTARTPYGNKSPDTIVKYSLNNVRFLLEQGADLIVIACNTASSHAYDAISSRYALPVFEVIGPGAQLAVEQSPQKENRSDRHACHHCIGSLCPAH